MLITITIKAITIKYVVDWLASDLVLLWFDNWLLISLLLTFEDLLFSLMSNLSLLTFVEESFLSKLLKEFVSPFNLKSFLDSWICSNPLFRLLLIFLNYLNLFELLLLTFHFLYCSSINWLNSFMFSLLNSRVFLTWNILSLRSFIAAVISLTLSCVISAFKSIKE